MNLDHMLHMTLVEFLSYRKFMGRLQGSARILSVQYTTGDVFDEFENNLCKLHKVSRDNHIGFILAEGNAQIIVVFSDWKMHIHVK